MGGGDFIVPEGVEEEGGKCGDGVGRRGDWYGRGVNRSAPGPDGISYRLVKMMLDTRLGRELVREIAIPLKEGGILEKWQRSKVVFIPKPNKDHQATKEWRPINLIN